MTAGHPVIVRQLQVWLERRGLGAPWSVWLSSLAILGAMLLIAFVAHRISRSLIRRAIKLRFRAAPIAWDTILIEHGTFSRLSHFVPALVLYHGSATAFPGRSDVVEVVHSLAIAYMIVAGCLTGNAVGRTLADGYEQKVGGERSIRSFTQVGEIIVWMLGGIMLLATFADRSPLTVLGGLGAFAAVVVLVFKDALLGLVASVQLSYNDMLRLGDWIEMPSHAADGEVIEILLTTVKVKNWDRTTTMVPAHALIQHAFVNWRSVLQDEARRITRAIVIDYESVRAVEDPSAEGFPALPASEGEDASEEYAAAPTNLGAFRQYATAYLRSHPQIRDDLTLVVRELEPTAEGLPLQFYCFSRQVTLAKYAVVRAEVVEHLMSAVPRFGLRLTQHPSANAVRSLAPAA